MASHPNVTIEPGPHPLESMRLLGFPLQHAYVEHCWGSRLGPTAVVFLRRLDLLWGDHVPLVVPPQELAGALGLGPSRSRLMPTLERLVHFNLAEWTDEPDHLVVYSTVRPLSNRGLGRCPALTRRLHERFLDEHLAQVEADARPVVPPAVEAARRLSALEGPVHPGAEVAL